MSSRKCPVCLEPCFSEDTGEHNLNLFAPSCHHGVCKGCICGIMKKVTYGHHAALGSSLEDDFTEDSGKLLFKDSSLYISIKFHYKCPCCNDITTSKYIKFGKVFYEEDESSNAKAISIEQSFNKNVSSFDEMMNKVQSLVSSTMKEHAERYDKSTRKCGSIIKGIGSVIDRERHLTRIIGYHNERISILKKNFSELDQNYESRFCAMKTQAREEVKREEERKYKELIDEEKERINNSNRDYICRMDRDFNDRVDRKVEHTLREWDRQKSNRETDLRKEMEILKYDLEMEAKQNAEKIRTKYKEKMTRQLDEFDSSMDEYKEFLSRREEFNQFKESSKEYQEFLRFKEFSSK